MKKTFACAALSAVLLLSLAAGCGSTAPSESEDNSTPVEVQTVARGDMVTENMVTGKVVSGNESSVYPMMSAEYTQVPVEVGDQVKAGDVLARLDVGAYQQQLSALTASYNSTQESFNAQISLLERQLSDTQALYEIGAASQMSVTTLESQLTTTRASASAQLNSLSTQIATLSDTVRKGVVTAPHDGTVTVVNAKVGSMAAPGSAAAVVAEDGYLQVETSVSESLAPKLAIGDKADVTISAIGKTVKGVISEADPAGNAVNALFSVTIDLPADCGATSGMSANITFYTDPADNAIIIPTDAILTSGNEQFVYVVDSENLAHRVVIETGLNNAGSTEVTGGLKGGETLVTSGQAYLTEGCTVRVVG